LDEALYGKGDLAEAARGLIETLREEPPVTQKRGVSADLALYPI
jgi:hypothetical protein